MATRATDRTAMRARSRKVTGQSRGGDPRAGSRDSVEPSGRDGRREDVGREAEEHEQDDEHDRELPEPALDAAAAAVDRGVAAERAAQPRAARLKQDRE